jgi:hypothetical protein
MLRARTIVCAASLVALTVAEDARADDTAPPETEANSPTMMYTGMSLTFGGLSTASLGAVLALSVMQMGGTPQDDKPQLWAGTVMMPIGGVMTLTGIGLWVAGAWKVPIGAEHDESESRPTISLSPTGGSLTWHW